MTHTHTYAVLEVSRAAYEEVAAKLREAGYAHAFHNDGEGVLIDMHGIALKEEKRDGGEPPSRPYADTGGEPIGGG